MGDDPPRGARDLGKPGDDRDRTAEDRDQRAEDHDHASEARDGRADVRDKRAEARERAAGGVDAGAAADRAGASRDRRQGASDRTHAADDREAAADDREAASVDRDLSARQQAASSLDELTGAYHREPGVAELERELTRAKRTSQPFTLAFVDIDDLKGTNDTFGHAAGDQRLREAIDSIRAHLRSYDLIVRYGGDEFLCSLLQVSMAEAVKRFSLVNAEMAATQHASVTVGFAELEAGDALADLIARADAAMYGRRQQRRSVGA